MKINIYAGLKENPRYVINKKRWKNEQLKLSITTQ